MSRFVTRSFQAPWPPSDSFPGDPTAARAQIGGMWVDYTGTQPTLAQVQAQAVNPPKVRSLFAIYNDLVALSASQKTNVWNDLTSGSPPKILGDTGPASDSIFLLWRIASNSSLPAATITDMKLTAAAYYVRDNPRYLVAPAFDPSINISGVA